MTDVSALAVECAELDAGFGWLCDRLGCGEAKARRLIREAQPEGCETYRALRSKVRGVGRYALQREIDILRAGETCVPMTAGDAGFDYICQPSGRRISPEAFRAAHDSGALEPVEDGLFEGCTQSWRWSGG